jgi:hypothetical protein
MKKISTLSFSILISIASFANDGHNHSTASAGANANINVGNNRFDPRPLAGKASVTGQPVRPADNDRALNNDNKRNDHGFSNNDHGYNSNDRNRNNTDYGKHNDYYDNRSNGNGHNIDKGYNSRVYKENDRYTHNTGYARINTYYNGVNNYYHAISNADFFAAARVMDRENDDARLLYAERIVDDNYLTAEQVRELAGYFSFDNYRFDFARYAYSKTLDKNNFGVVVKAFSSYDGREQLMDFLRTCQ